MKEKDQAVCKVKQKDRHSNKVMSRLFCAISHHRRSTPAEVLPFLIQSNEIEIKVLRRDLSRSVLVLPLDWTTTRDSYMCGMQRTTDSPRSY